MFYVCVLNEPKAIPFPAVETFCLPSDLPRRYAMFFHEFVRSAMRKNKMKWDTLVVGSDNTVEVFHCTVAFEAHCISVVQKHFFWCFKQLINSSVPDEVLDQFVMEYDCAIGDDSMGNVYFWPENEGVLSCSLNGEENYCTSLSNGIELDLKRFEDGDKESGYYYKILLDDGSVDSGEIEADVVKSHQRGKLRTVVGNIVTQDMEYYREKREKMINYAREYREMEKKGLEDYGGSIIGKKRALKKIELRAREELTQLQDKMDEIDGRGTTCESTRKRRRSCIKGCEGRYSKTYLLFFEKMKRKLNDLKSKGIRLAWRDVYIELTTKRLMQKRSVKNVVDYEGDDNDEIDLVHDFSEL